LWKCTGTGAEEILTPNRDIAIVVPSFNGSSTIRETLQSVQAQQSGRERVAQVVLVDDHSTDDTPAAAQSCWTSDMQLVISRNAHNKGPWTNVNDGIRALPGHIQWFFILHQDDLAKPNWLEVMLRGIDQSLPRTASLTASYDVLFPDGRIAPGENFGETRKVIVEGTPQNVRNTLRQGCWWKISSCAIRVSAFWELGGFLPEFLYFSDWDFVLRALRSGWTIEYIPLCLSVFRRSERCLSSKCFREHRDVREALMIFEQFREFLPFPYMAGLHFYYLYTLARRSAASMLHGDLERIAMAGATGGRVAASLLKNIAHNGRPHAPLR
jgi:glycosyltransferase involved in cell wall biosynthesis